MFVLSELYLSGGSPSLHFFKPWWDLVIDYLNMGMLMLTLIAFANVTLLDGEGIICTGIKRKYTWPQVIGIRGSFNFYLHFDSLNNITNYRRVRPETSIILILRGTGNFLVLFDIYPIVPYASALRAQ